MAWNLVYLKRTYAKRASATLEVTNRKEYAMRKPRHLVPRVLLSLLATLLFFSVTQAQSSQEAPTYKITPEVSRIKFNVKASIPLEGTFEKWDATLAFTSTDPSTGSLDIKIQADSLNTGSKPKDKKLKGSDCLDAKDHPDITFRSTKIIQTGPHTFDVPGTFSVRGISKAETLNFTAEREGAGTGEIEGVLWFEPMPGSHTF